MWTEIPPCPRKKGDDMRDLKKIMAEQTARKDSILPERGPDKVKERRERIATAALQGLLSTGEFGKIHSIHIDNYETAGLYAIEAADALIAKLDEEEE